MLIYFIFGGLFVGLQMYIWNLLKRTGKANLFLNSLVFLFANSFLVLGLAWMYASIVEHEMQAAMLGLVVFGGLGIVLGIVGYRLNFGTSIKIS
jgi:hypothetical protein